MPFQFENVEDLCCVLTKTVAGSAYKREGIVPSSFHEKNLRARKASGSPNVSWRSKAHFVWSILRTLNVCSDGMHCDNTECVLIYTA